MPADPEYTAGGTLDVDLVESLTDADLHSDTRAAQIEEARKNRAQYEAFLRGADERVRTLPREGIRGKAFAATNLMLSNILTGRIKPKTAEEAAKVAKITYDLGRREVGDEDLATQITSPESRERAMESVRDMLLAAKARAVEEGLLPPPDEILDAEVVDEDDLAAGEAAGVPVRSAIPGPALVRVPRDSS